MSLICAHSSAAMRAVLMGDSFQPKAACVRACASALACAAASLAPRACEGRFAVRGHLPFDLLDQCGKRFFSIGADREIHFLVAPEVLVVAVAEEVEGADA